MEIIILTSLLLKFSVPFIAVGQCKMAEPALQNQKYFTKVPGDGKRKH